MEEFVADGFSTRLEESIPQLISEVQAGECWKSSGFGTLQSAGKRVHCCAEAVRERPLT